MFWSESGEKSASDQAAFTRQNSSKQICGWILMWETTGDALSHWRKSYYGLWNHILVQNVLMLDLFHLLSSQDINWWTGVVWINCGLLWCFYQTLILTAPIHCRASIAETLMQWHISTNLMKKQTHPNLIDGLRMRTSSSDVHVFYKLFAHLHQPTEQNRTKTSLLAVCVSVSGAKIQKRDC